MRFIKSFFSSDPKENIREKLKELEINDKAVNLTDEIDEDDFRLVVEVAQEFIDKGILTGDLIGRKGWFLPNAQDKYKVQWRRLEKGKLSLEEVSGLWKINEKRVYIALEDYAKTQGQEEPIFHREDRDIWLESYLKKEWIDALSGFEFEENGVEFENIIDNLKVSEETRNIIEEKAKENWLTSETSSYALGSDGIVRRRDLIPELIKKQIPEMFDGGTTQVTYYELAQKFGLTEDKAGKILQQLVDDRELGEVTLYPLDRKLVPRL